MIKKIFISDNKDIGLKCKSWASNNLPDGFTIVDDMVDCDIFLSVQYDKILSKTTNSEILTNLTKKKAQPISTKDKLDNMVPNKKGATVDDKFAEKTNQKGKTNLKQFEEASASAESDNNVKISFSGLKDKIETNKD